MFGSAVIFLEQGTEVVAALGLWLAGAELCGPTALVQTMAREGCRHISKSVHPLLANASISLLISAAGNWVAPYFAWLLWAWSTLMRRCRVQQKAIDRQTALGLAVWTVPGDLQHWCLAVLPRATGVI